MKLWAILLMISAGTIPAHAQSASDTLSKLGCLNPPSAGYDLKSSLDALDKRVVDCFNTTQALAKEREMRTNSKVMELETRIKRLESQR